MLMLAAAGAASSLDPKDEMLLEVLKVRRVCVEPLTGGETAAHIRNMIISSLQRAGLFVITENEERADALLRGSAEDLVFTDTYQTSDGVDGRISIGVSRSRPGATRSTERQGFSLGGGAGDHESTRIAERKHEASATVRLVSKDGDVIWATTQESLGGKFRGASADVADKITRQLMDDYDRARKLSAAPKPSR